MIFHAAAFDTAGDIRVADVWESQEALDDFFNKRSLHSLGKLPEPETPTNFTDEAEISGRKTPTQHRS